MTDETAAACLELIARFQRLLDAAQSSGIPDWYLTLSTELEEMSSEFYS